MVALQVTSVAQESQTYDEAVYIAAGYSYWQTGDFRINTEHPPLAKLLVAAPLLPLHLDLPLNSAAWQHADQYTFGANFLYHNRLSPDAILNIVRNVKSPWFALNLDLGNFHTDDVYRDLVKCAPYAVNVHFKKVIQLAGRPAEPADISRMLKILGDANYQGYLAMEYEEDDDPYLAIPGWKRDVTAALKAANLG